MKTALGVVDFMERHLDKSDIPGGVKCMMLDLNMPEDLDGYDTLILAIPAFRRDPKQLMTKELYVDLGKQLGISSGKVEKDIREVIKKAWKRRDREIWWLYFPQTTKPSNREFIARLAQILDIWQNCKSKKSGEIQEEIKA